MFTVFLCSGVALLNRVGSHYAEHHAFPEWPYHLPFPTQCVKSTSAVPSTAPDGHVLYKDVTMLVVPMPRSSWSILKANTLEMGEGRTKIKFIQGPLS